MSRQMHLATAERDCCVLVGARRGRGAGARAGRAPDQVSDRDSGGGCARPALQNEWGPQSLHRVSRRCSLNFAGRPPTGPRNCTAAQALAWFSYRGSPPSSLARSLAYFFRPVPVLGAGN